MGESSSTRFGDGNDTGDSERLRRRVAELEQLLDAVGGIVWEADADSFRHTYVSRQAERLLGFPVERWTSDAGFWSSRLHDEDREWAMNCRFATAQGRGDRDCEYRMIAADGTAVWLHDFVTAGEVSGATRTLRGVMVDVTSRREAERRVAGHSEALLGLARSAELERGDFEAFAALALETAARTLGVERMGVWLFDAERRVLRCHHLYELGADLHSAGPQIDSACYPRYFEALAAGRFVAADDAQADPRTAEFADGYLRPLGITSMLDAPLRGGGGVIGVVCHEHVGLPRHWTPDERDFAASVAHFVAHALEVQKRTDAERAALAAQAQLLAQQRRETERVAAELDRARERLVRQTRLGAIGQIAASIAHELRNPLAAIQNARFFLRRRIATDDPKVGEYLGIIEQEVHTADRIIDNLLEMTRAKDPVKARIDLAKAARAALALVEGAEAVRFELGLPRRPFEVEADPDQLRQVLSNLFTNSVQALDGKGTIELNARELDGGGVEIRVTDDGPGIAATDSRRVFEALFTTRAKGTGLGLAVCRQIMDNHGGSIEVEPRRGRGASFVIRLPGGPAAGEETA